MTKKKGALLRAPAPALSAEPTHEDQKHVPRFGAAVRAVFGIFLHRRLHEVIHSPDVHFSVGSLYNARTI